MAKKVCQNCLVTLYFYFISLKRSIDKIHLQNVMSGSNAAFVMIQMINVLCFQEQSWCFLLITTTENGQKWFPLRHESSSKNFFTPYFNVFWLHLLYGILNTQYVIQAKESTPCQISIFVKKVFFQLVQNSLFLKWFTSVGTFYYSLEIQEET